MSHQDPRDQADFKDGRKHIEHQSRENEIDTPGIKDMIQSAHKIKWPHSFMIAILILFSCVPCSSIHGPGHGTRLSGDMVAKVEGVEMEKGGLGNTTDGTLGHFCKDCVAKLIEERGAQSGCSVWVKSKSCCHMP